jgi:hypothetical protein
MEHDHIGHHQRPTWPQANSQPHTLMRDSSDFDDELRLAPTESSTGRRLPVIVAIGTLHRSSKSTATRRSTREPIGHAGKTDYRSLNRDPKLCSPHHHCQTARSAARERHYDGERRRFWSRGRRPGLPDLPPPRSRARCPHYLRSWEAAATAANTGARVCSPRSAPRDGTGVRWAAERGEEGGK